MNKNIEIEITKLKLEKMNTFEIFTWLEKNKKQKQNIFNNKEIVTKLFDKKDKLINIGLAMYSRVYTYEMYINASSHEEKMAYLSSEVNNFIGEAGDIIIGLITEYNKLISFKDKQGIYQVEDKLKAFFNNKNIYRFRCILMDLYCKTCEPKARLKKSKYGIRENIFKDINEALWLKLISYTANHKILSEYDKTIDETYAPDYCSNYLNMFWMLFSKIEANEKNAEMLVDMIESNDAIRNNHSFICTPEIISRWKSHNDNIYFFYARYYLAQTNEDLLSDKSDDLAIRRAYYSSSKFLKELNQNLPDESRLSDMYNYEENYTYYVNKFEEYYKKDGNDFLEELIHNNHFYLDNLLLQHALGEISGKDIVYLVARSDKIKEMDKKYPNRFKKYNELSEVDKLESEADKKQYALEKIQNINSKITQNFKTLNNISFLPNEFRINANATQTLLIIVIILEILNIFL